jgi:hypothetical protein
MVLLYLLHVVIKNHPVYVYACAHERGYTNVPYCLKLIIRTSVCMVSLKISNDDVLQST